MSSGFTREVYVITVLVAGSLLVGLVQPKAVYVPNPLPAWALTIDLSTSKEPPNEAGLPESLKNGAYFARIGDVTNLFPDESEFRFNQVLPTTPKFNERGSHKGITVLRRDVAGRARVLAIGAKNELVAFEVVEFANPGNLAQKWFAHFQERFGPPTSALRHEAKKGDGSDSHLVCFWEFKPSDKDRFSANYNGDGSPFLGDAPDLVSSTVSLMVAFKSGGKWRRGTTVVQTGHPQTRLNLAVDWPLGKCPGDVFSDLQVKPPK